MAIGLEQVGCGRGVRLVLGLGGWRRDRFVRGGRLCGLLSRHRVGSSLEMRERFSFLSSVCEGVLAEVEILKVGAMYFSSVGRSKNATPSSMTFCVSSSGMPTFLR